MVCPPATTSTITNASASFAGNDVFQPITTPTVSAPVPAAMFSHWAGLYNAFVVLGSKISIRGAISGDPAASNLIAATLSATRANLPTFVVQPGGNWHATRFITPTLGPISPAATPGTGGYHSSRPFKFRKYLSSKAVFQHKALADQATFWGTGLSSPSTLWHWNMMISPVGLSSNVHAWYMVKLTYYVKWFDPIDLTNNVIRANVPPT